MAADHSAAASHGAAPQPTARGGAELVAANLSLLVVVVAPRPAPDLFLVDRYLAAGASAGIATLLLANKADLRTRGGLAR